MIDRSPASPPRGYLLRPAWPEDVPALCAVERRAASTFADFGFPGIAAEPERAPDDFTNAFAGAAIRVATDEADQPAGFAATTEIAGHLWLLEISVDPSHGRRGVGSALLGADIAEAARRGLRGIGLSTFRDVPFNAPFYRSHGFREIAVEAAPALLAERFEAEVPPGIDRATRLLMIRDS